MNRVALMLSFLSVGAIGCGDGTPETEVTEVDHSQHLGGGNQGEVDSTGTTVRQVVHLTTDQERALGVTYTEVRREPMMRTVRTVGRIAAPEPKIVDVTPKIDGFVEEMYVSFTGEAVRRGQPLLSLYSPTLVAAQEELLTASRMMGEVDPSAEDASRSARSMLDATRRRLAFWDITADQIDAIQRSGEVQRALTLVAPANGVVLEKFVVEGQRVQAGTRLYRIVDLAEVWVEGDVFEQDLQFVHVDQPAHIEVQAYPGEHLMGLVSFVYPVVDEQSRTNRIRVTVSNADGRLKPGMFATIYLDATIGRDVLTVSRDAVIVTGERNLVFQRADDGMLYPREVVIGARGGDRVQILSGLEEGETVVASANFLIDAESRLGVRATPCPACNTGRSWSLTPHRPCNTIMIESVIEWSLRNRFLVLLATGALIGSGIWAMQTTPLDAIPDLSDVQVIVQTDFREQAPQIVEDQITYPIASEMLKVPGASVVRGFSFFGLSLVYVIFEDGTDIYWARSRVLEYLNGIRQQLPQGDRANPWAGRDRCGVGVRVHPRVGQSRSS